MNLSIIYYQTIRIHIFLNIQSNKKQNPNSTVINIESNSRFLEDLYVFLHIISHIGRWIRCLEVEDSSTSEFDSCQNSNSGILTEHRSMWIKSFHITETL